MYARAFLLAFIAFLPLSLLPSATAMAAESQDLSRNGKREAIQLDGDTYTVEWLAHEAFDSEDWSDRWVVEGSSDVKVVDGRLYVRKRDPEQRNTATIWFRPELPQNVVVRFRAKPVLPAEENAANLNLFLHARELDGSPVRFGRSGNYKEYHGIPNYIVTFVGGCRPGWSRARRDPGFNLLHETEIRTEVGTEYALAVTYQDGRLRYYVDDTKIHDVRDPEPLPGGRFGIRSWSTNAWWDDVEIGRIVEERE